MPECQSPLFLFVDSSDPERVRLHFSAGGGPDHPRLRVDPHQGLDGHSAATILAVPDDFYSDLGLADAVSPLRLRGMSAMLARIKRHLRN